MSNRNRLFNFLLTVATLIVSSSLGACGGDTNPMQATPGGGMSIQPTTRADFVSAVNPERTTIRFAVFDTDFSLFKRLAERFEQENPGIQVQLVSINQVLSDKETGDDWSDDDWKKLVAAADTLALRPRIDLTGKKLLRDLSPLMDADSGFDAQDFYAGALADQQWENGTWGVPVAVDFSLIFYDKTLFDEAKVTPPEMNWRTADFTARAQALAQQEGETITRYGFVPDTNIVHTMLVINQVGPFFDTQVDPPLPRLNTPEMQQAVIWYTDLVREQIMPDPIVGESLRGRGDLAQPDKAAMWSGGLSELIHPDNDRDVGVLPFPCYQGDSCIAHLGVKSYVMSAGTLHPQESWRWLVFLTRQPPQDLTGKDYLLPARRSVAASVGFWQGLKDEQAQVLRYVLTHYSPIRGDAAYLLGILHQALASIFRGDKAVAEALAAAQVQAKERILSAHELRAEATPVAVLPAEPTQAQSENVTEITYAVGTSPKALEEIRRLAEEFNALQDTIYVDVVPPDFGRTMNSFGVPAMAQQADCFVWFGETQREIYADNLLALDPLLEVDPAFALDDFYPQWIKVFQVDGIQWGIPAYIQPAIMRYNRDLFDTANVPYPVPDWNLDDFLAIALALTDQEQGQYGFVPHAGEMDELFFFVPQRGGQIVDAQQVPAVPRLDSPEVVEGVQWYLDLDKVKPSFAVTKDRLYDNKTYEKMIAQRLTLIRKGQAAMWIELPEYFGDSGTDVTGLNTGVVPLPQGPGKEGTFAIAGYFISASTEHPKACWTWIDFLTRKVSSTTSGLPARRSVAESDEYRQQVGDEIAQVYYLAIVSGRSSSARYQSQWIAPYFSWFLHAYLDIISGTDVHLALSIAQGKAEEYRQCIHLRDGFASESVWQACLGEVDSAYSIPSFENP